MLDNLAVTFSAALVLPHALAAIQLKLQAGAGGSGSAEVWVRESGMLALGALSTGCLIEMGQYLPQLFPFLIQVIHNWIIVISLLFTQSFYIFYQDELCPLILTTRFYTTRIL